MMAVYENPAFPPSSKRNLESLPRAAAILRYSTAIYAKRLLPKLHPPHPPHPSSSPPHARKLPKLGLYANRTYT